MRKYRNTSVFFLLYGSSAGFGIGKVAGGNNYLPQFSGTKKRAAALWLRLFCVCLYIQQFGCFVPDGFGGTVHYLYCFGAFAGFQQFAGGFFCLIHLLY